MQGTPRQRRSRNRPLADFFHNIRCTHAMSAVEIRADFTLPITPGHVAALGSRSIAARQRAGSIWPNTSSRLRRSWLSVCSSTLLVCIYMIAHLVASGRPVSRASSVSRMPAPSAPSRSDRQATRAGSVFVLDGHGCTHGTRTGHIPSKSDKVRVRDDSIVDVDCEIVRRIACTSLCRENKVPRPIKGRACLRRGSGRDETARDHR